MAKMKTFMAMSVDLRPIPNKHRGSNQNAQFTIVVRAESRKKVAEMLGSSTHHLRDFCGIRELDAKAEPRYASIPKKDNVIYYHVEQTKFGFVNEWLEWTPNSYTEEELRLTFHERK